MPLRHPLLDKAVLTPDDVLGYSIFRWHTETCPLLVQQIAGLAKTSCEIQPVASFELMALWVAAGYGIGITMQSRLSHAREWGICMRSFVDAPYEIITHLVCPTKHRHDAHERFACRALRVAEIPIA